MSTEQGRFHQKNAPKKEISRFYLTKCLECNIISHISALTGKKYPHATHRKYPVDERGEDGSGEIHPRAPPRTVFPCRLRRQFPVIGMRLRVFDKQPTEASFARKERSKVVTRRRPRPSLISVRAEVGDFLFYTHKGEHILCKSMKNCKRGD